MTWKVPQFVPFLGQEEEEAVRQCIASGWITEGPLCEELIEQLKKLTGVTYGVLAPNGTLAIYLALKACGVRPGQEVIVPDLTFVATATAVVMAGCTPVFADVNRYGQISLSAVRKAMGPETQACIPVHLYGVASDEIPGEDRLKELCLIEDACQALGVTYREQPCGSFGDASAFSLFADKTITTGEGGFVGTNSAAVYDSLRYLRNQGRLERGSFVHLRIGQNFRMTDLQAAVGLEQLKKFPEIVRRKRAIYRAYTERLSGVVEFLPIPDHSTHIPFRTVALFEADASLASHYLKERGVEPRGAFHPLHGQPCFKSLADDSRHADKLFEQANYLYDHALCLPTFPSLTEEQLDYVCSTIKSFVAEAE